MPLRVSLVNLQQFTFHKCGDWASIRMLAPAQDTLSTQLVTTTALTRGVLEAQALRGVVEFDVHAQAVGVALQLVAGHQPRLGVNGEGERGDGTVEAERPCFYCAGSRSKVTLGVCGGAFVVSGESVTVIGCTSR